MADHCTHLKTITDVVPSARGCEDCLKIGSKWVHLRLCRSCGHVGCCDDSPHRHATAHFKATQHPIIEGYDPPEGWGWCYVDEIEVELPDQTRQVGPIPRYYWGASVFRRSFPRMVPGTLVQYPAATSWSSARHTTIAGTAASVPSA